MATVSLIDPYSQQAEEIARRKRMAQALQESGSQVLQMPTTPGVAISPYAGLAKILESGLGAYQEKKARDDYAKLQNEYRTNYNRQFGDLARAISAPAQEAFAGQEAVEAQPAQMAPKIEQGFGGYGMQREVGQFETAPAVEGRAAIPAKPAVPAGYISPETLQGIDIPEVKQLAMAKYLAQFEPKDIKLGQGDTLYRQVGSGPLVEQAVGKAAAKTQERPIVLGEGQSAYDTSGKLLVAGPAKATKAAESKWEKGQKTVDGKTVYGWYDLAAPNYEASFKAGAVPPAGEKSNWKEVTRGDKVFYEDFNIADAAQRQAGAIAKEAAKIDQIQLEVQDDSGAKKTILVNKDDPRLKEGIATKGADTVMITEVNDKGQPLVRYVKKDDQILTKGYVKPLEGFLGQLQAAGVPMNEMRGDPKIMDLVNRYFVKTAGGVAPEDVAGFDLRKAEVVARLGELGINVPANIKGLGLSVTPGITGSAQPSSAASASTASANDMKSKVEAGGLKYEPAKYDYRINADGSVQRKAK